MPTVQIPLGQELSAAFSQVFRSWTHENLQYAGLPLTIGQDACIEWSVSIPGTVTGWLTVRGDQSFAPELSRMLLGGDHATLEEGSDAFKELVNQFTSHLVSDVLKTDTGHFDPFIPVPTLPSHWPSRRPESSCSLTFKGHVVEVRLWIDQPPVLQAQAA